MAKNLKITIMDFYDGLEIFCIIILLQFNYP